MPICPRCGKCLSSEQALTYHLNRKYKCGTWNCVKCKTNFNTKFNLQMHELECLGDRSTMLLPTTDMLLDVYNALPFMCVHLNPDTERSDIVSPHSATLFHLPPTSLLKLSKEDLLSRIRCATNSTITHHDVNENMFFVLKKIN